MRSLHSRCLITPKISVWSSRLCSEEALPRTPQGWSHYFADRSQGCLLYFYEKNAVLLNTFAWKASRRGSQGPSCCWRGGKSVPRHVPVHVSTGMSARGVGRAHPQEHTATAKLGSHTRQMGKQALRRPPGSPQRAF